MVKLTVIASNIAKIHQMDMSLYDVCVYNTRYLNSPIYFNSDDNYENDWLMCFSTKTEGQRVLFDIKEYIDLEV